MKRTTFKKVPFDLELAKKITNKEVKGRIVNGMGSEVRIIYFDKMGIYPIVGLIRVADGEEVYTFSENGRQDIRCVENSFDIHIEVPTYHKDYSNFVPCKLQPCLVRNGKCDDWWVRVCAGKNENNDMMFYYERGYGKEQWNEFLPLNKITARLFTTTKSYEDLIKELDAELTAITENE